MKQINRFGIELDVCPSSGGVGSIAGELEKLLDLIKQSAEEDLKRYSEATSRKTTPHDEDYYRRDHRHKYSEDDFRKGYYKKKSGLSKLMDMFDF